MWLSGLTIQLIGFRVLSLLIIAGVQGATVAATAVALGDKGPKYDGRMTVAPTRHIDLLGAIGLVLFGLGWGRPMDIDARQFRIGRIGVVVVILAGFLGLLVCAALLSALILPALTALPQSAALTTAAFFRAAANLSIWVALLGLVPIPPLTAGLLLGAFGLHVSRQVQAILAALLLVAVATGVARRILDPAHAVLASIILGQ